ncbi:uncharacterized protein LOC115228835 [Octopus sinensis]|uniref:ATP-dependent DNA helicase n=1 Tax=Octopus sinensis TaxID=2607531 RepID=A0A6P7U0V4_9MOLL|nr:uncharacterized protein LOC115228835 [Octopus sinensis]
MPVKRSNESSEMAKFRREKNRLRMARKRSEETQNQKEVRQQLDRVRTAVRRDQEPEDQRELRQQLDKVRTAARRDQQPEDQRELRQQLDKVRTAVRREQEPEDQRELRQQLDRVRTAVRRDQEPEDQRELRQQLDKVRTAVRRDQEPEDQREHRLNQNTRRNTERRNQQTQNEHNAENRHRVSRRNSRLYNYISLVNVGFSYNIHTDYSDLGNIGALTEICTFCLAMKFKGETIGMCCSRGKVRLPVLDPPPKPLLTLLRNDTPSSRHFVDNIRRYNNVFQMTSFGTSGNFNPTGYMPTFKVLGQVYHRMGSLLPSEGEDFKFLQIYFIDNHEEQSNRRCLADSRLRGNIISSLQNMLQMCNTYISSFRSVLRSTADEDCKVIIHADRTPANEHNRRYNAPTSNQVGILIVGQHYDSRDIIINKRSTGLMRISETHRSYDALQYPLLFPRGEDGYNFKVMHFNPSTGLTTTKKTSCMEFYSYRLMIREQEFNILHRTGQLFNQFIVDMYAKIEAERLLYIRLNQRKLRAEEYIHLRDAIMNDGNVSNVGQMVILPSSFTGGPRYMHERTQDAMTYVRNYGTPDLFITFTCNPKWPEISDNIFVGQKVEYRQDIIARVFKQKVDKMIDLLCKGQIFGKTRCHMYTVEWQKRGLPHVHILVWLVTKIRPTEIDDCIRAELPNPNEDRELYEIIKRNMIHGPCGIYNRSSPCMQDGKCSKGYPKNLIINTQTGENGFPFYQRRGAAEGGYTATLHEGKENEITVDNRWIVPYNPLLSKIFDAHINVEFCNSIRSIKYVCKYINKGSDQAIFSIEQRDEPTFYQHGRYICSNEGAWRIFGYPIHERYPLVMHLGVHLENGQRIYFTEQNARNQVTNARNSTLMAFFELCRTDQFAKTIYYVDVPRYYTWDVAGKRFKRRIRGNPVNGHSGIVSADALGRVYTVHPNNFECYCVRLLLHTVRGPESFTDLRTVDGVLCETYREACFKLGLLEDDNHWNQTLTEAELADSSSRLRYLFTLMLAHCGLANPQQLWEGHRESMCEDILREKNRLSFDAEIFNIGLIMIDRLLISIVGKSVGEFGFIISDIHNINSFDEHYNLEELRTIVEEREQSLTTGQLEVYREINRVIQEENGSIIFIDAPGGTGKTYLLNLLLAKVRSENKLALAVASSGIAATLLDGGRTAHSTFNIPLNLSYTTEPELTIRLKETEKKLNLLTIEVNDTFIYILYSTDKLESFTVENIKLKQQIATNKENLVEDEDQVAYFTKEIGTYKDILSKLQLKMNLR